MSVVVNIIDGQMNMYQCANMTAAAPSQRVEEACCWVMSHGDAWRAMLRLIDALEANGQTRCVRRGDVWILAERQGMSVSLTRELRFDNNLWATLSRLMVLQRPARAHIIHPRRCDVNKDGTPGIDSLDIASIYRDVTGDTQTPLLSRREFRALMGWSA